MRATLRHHGVSGLFKGVVPTLLQVVPNVGLTFAANGQLRAAYDALATRFHGNSEQFWATSHALRAVICGALAGTLAKLVTYPLDTVKRRVQAAGMRRHEVYGAPPRVHATTLATLVAIAREEGILRGLYKGTAPALLKSGIGAAATFGAYDIARSALAQFDWAVAK